MTPMQLLDFYRSEEVGRAITELVGTGIVKRTERLLALQTLLIAREVDEKGPLSLELNPADCRLAVLSLSRSRPFEYRGEPWRVAAIEVSQNGWGWVRLAPWESPK